MDNEQINFQGFGGSPPAPPIPRTPVIDHEGATGFLTTGLSVSLTQIRVLDLISEGEIEGLNSGVYTYSGTIGNIGYDTVSFSGYANAPGTTVNFLPSIYWDTIPIVDSNNKFNFQQAQVLFTPGTALGSSSTLVAPALQDSLTISRTINERLRGGGETWAKTYRILNVDCKACNINIKVAQMYQTDVNPSTYGDIHATEISYSIYYRPLFANSDKTPRTFSLGKQEVIKAKISYGYIRKSNITLTTSVGSISDQDFIGWEIKIIRSTPDSTDNTLSNQTFVDSLTEVYGDIYTYPNSAIVASTFSAEFFSQIPARIFDAKLLKVLVPSNYDTTKRTYAGSWDGTFKDNKEWTDNPAWCFYDLLTNSRYGLGNHISSDFVDKWTLYEIAKYCDVMVSDGLGGIEPRLSCNVIINTLDDAYKVINNMASIFRAMVYYSAGTVYAVQDAEKDPVFQFTNANVENGDFSYSSSSRRVRHSVALVRYNDKTNYYQPAVEYIENVQAIKQYGIRQIDISAYGCVSRGQAIRFGRWALLSENLQTETISFIAGLEGAYLRPGDIFQVFDANRIQPRLAGRTYGINSNLITLDDKISGLSPSTVYTFSLLAPTYNYDTSLVELNDDSEAVKIRNDQIQEKTFSGAQSSYVTGSDGITRTLLTLNAGFDSVNYNITGNLIWSISVSGAGLSDTTTLGANNAELYSTISITEKDTNHYQIIGLQYDPTKYDQIESGFSYVQNSVSTNAPAPDSISLTQQNLTANGNTKLINYVVNLSNNSGVTSYPVYARLGAWGALDLSGANASQYLINILPVSSPSGSYLPTQAGTYYFRAFSSSAAGNRSTNYAENSISISNINPIQDILIGSLTLDGDTGNNAAGTKYTGAYTSSSPTFKWQVGFAQSVTIPSDFNYRISFRKPSLNNTPSNNVYFQVTGYKPANASTLNYTFKISDNINAVSSNGERGPFREYDVVVEAMNGSGLSSAGGNFAVNGDSYYNNPNGYDILYVNNPRITGVRLSTGNLVLNNGYVTDQWITSDGNIDIAFLSGTQVPDVAGGIIYFSQFPFTSDEAKNVVPNSKGITAVSFVGNNNPIDVPARIINPIQAYMGVSLYDIFDKALQDAGTNIITGLDMTNVVLIPKRGAFTQANYIYQSWIDIVGSGNVLSSNVSYTSAGIAGASYSMNDMTLRVQFITALPSANYTVLSYQNSPTVSNIFGNQQSPNVFGIVKTPTGFYIPPNNAFGGYFYGSRVFAVLHDGVS